MIMVLIQLGIVQFYIPIFGYLYFTFYRLTAPDIGFKFHDLKIDGHHVVVLVIPAAVKVPTSFDHERYIRIVSSKESVTKYPEREAQLFDVLTQSEKSPAST